METKASVSILIICIGLLISGTTMIIVGYGFWVSLNDHPNAISF